MTTKTHVHSNGRHTKELFINAITEQTRGKSHYPPMLCQRQLVIHRRECVGQVFFCFIHEGSSVGVHNCLAVMGYYERFGHWNGVQNGILEDRWWSRENVRVQSVGIKPDFRERIFVEHDTGVGKETLSDHPTKGNSGKTGTGSVAD